MSRKPEITLLDIETKPAIGYLWSTKPQYIPIDRIVEPGGTICWAAKKYGQKKVTFMSEYHDGYEDMVKGAWDVLDSADAVITFNGDNFDLPTLNKAFLFFGLTPPSPYVSIDLYKTVRKNFRLESNKLDYVNRCLGLPAKVQHKGMGLWHGCMQGEPSDWRMMKRYNMQDVRMMEPLYETLRPWIKSQLNHGLFTQESAGMRCKNCGSRHLQRRGVARTKTQVYARFQCQSCGTWQRSRKTQLPGNNSLV